MIQKYNRYKINVLLNGSKIFCYMAQFFEVLQLLRGMILRKTNDSLNINIFEKYFIMRYYNQSSFVLPDGVSQYLQTLYIQIVSRFIQHDHVRGMTINT